MGKYFGSLENKEILSEQMLAKYFPKFVWVLRDFSLELKTDKDVEMTADDYLEYTLMVKKESTKIPLVEEINKSYLMNEPQLKHSQSLRQ